MAATAVPAENGIVFFNYKLNLNQIAVVEQVYLSNLKLAPRLLNAERYISAEFLSTSDFTSWWQNSVTTF